MQYKWMLNLIVASLALNLTTFSYADADFEETEAVIETLAEQAGETEFEESEIEDETLEETEEKD